MKIGCLAFLVLSLVAGVGCARQETASQSNLTPGMAKKYIYSGKTSETEVMEIFGPPDLVTHKNGKDVWTYDKISQEVTASNGFLTIILAGYSKSRQTQSNRSVMLIVYFDKKEIVEDYKLSAAKF